MKTTNYKIDIVNPYSDYGVKTKIVTTIMSKNIRGYNMQRNKTNEQDDFVNKFDNLYKLDRLVNLSKVEIPKNVCNYLKCIRICWLSLNRLLIF